MAEPETIPRHLRGTPRRESENAGTGITWDNAKHGWREDGDGDGVGEEEESSQRTAVSDSPEAVVAEKMEKGELPTDVIWLEWDEGDTANPFNVSRAEWARESAR